MFKNILQSHKERMNRPLILDGAMGSLLQQRGIESDKYLWTATANIYNPEIVTDLHKQYIEAGADIITTNTFRTNPSAINYSRYNFNSKAMVDTAVELAKSAREETEILIAGSNSPAEDCYQKERNIRFDELRDNHLFHIEYLYESGVDFILNETMSHLDEIIISSSFCYDNEIPFAISLFLENENSILSGEPVTEIFNIIKDYSPICTLINCVNIKTFKNFINKYGSDSVDGFYLNCGSGNYSDTNIQCAVSPNEYIDALKQFMNQQTMLVGSCCGSTPGHTKLIREFFNETN